MKKLFLVLSVLLASLPLTAQNETRAIAQFQSPIKKSLVRSTSGSDLITYIESGSEHYFAYSDATPAMKCADLGSSRFVEDFEILDDRYVFFCGRDISTTLPHGIFGWFDISALFSGNDPFHILDILPSTFSPHDIHTINHIVVFSDPAAHAHIAAIGRDQANKTRIFEMVGPINGPWLLKIGQSSYASYEKMHDITVTERYVVTAGVLNNYTTGIALRAYSKYNMFPTGGIQDILHYFTFGAANSWLAHPMQDFSITSIGHDRVAAASFGHALNQFNIYQSFLCGVYDINLMLSQPDACTVENYEYLCNNVAGACDILDLRYNDSTQNLLLLTQSAGYAGNQRYFAELDLSSGAVLSNCIANASLSGIDNHGATTSYVSVGADNNPNRMIVYKKAFSATPHCVNGTIGTSTDPGHSCDKKSEFPLWVNEYNVKFSKLTPLKRTNLPLTVECGNIR